MKIDNLRNFKRSWIIGNFEPSLFKNQNFEVGIQSYLKGEDHAAHYHSLSEEINIVLSGKCKFRFLVKEHEEWNIKDTITLEENDVLIIEKNEIVSFKAMSDCKILCVKIPSCPNDKHLI
jgi:quercetin dioxygenase-like cupin family protein